MKFNKLLVRDNFKWKYLQNAVLEGAFDMPVLHATDQLPRNLVGFHLANGYKAPQNSWFHFYIDDYRFERLWNRPARYLPLLQKFEGGIGTDFSIYLDMPRSQQIWNCWRNRVITHWMQTNGITVIPNVGWSDEASLEWAFDGIPQNSVLAVTTQGCMHDGVCKQSFINGLYELMRVKHPTTVCVYGQFPESWRSRFPVPIISYPTFASERWRA